MQPVVTSTIVDPAALDPAACDVLIEELYAVHDAIFEGVDRETFVRYVVRSPAERTRIQVYRDVTDGMGAEGDGPVVGYAAVHMFDREIDGRPIVVARCEVGLLPAYRRQTRFGWFFVREALGQLLRDPGRRMVGLSCATNPATYRTLTRHAAEVWPRWDRPTPPEVAALMRSLARELGLRPVDPARPDSGVVHVGWQTRESEQERRAWTDTTHPAARFYLDRNPGYRQGHGMMTLVPMGAVGFVRSTARFVLHQLERTWRRRKASTGRAVPR